MYRLVSVVGTIVLVLLTVTTAAGVDPPFRRTTPRGSFGRDGPELVIGVPGGRAWGIESALVPVPEPGAAFSVTVEVDDASVREAFVRVAWYDRATGRPKQFAIRDTRFVRAAETATMTVTLDPPDGAVAYRLRVLARLRAPAVASDPAAIRVSIAPLAPSGYPAEHLLP
jgi:hypothetical protein